MYRLLEVGEVIEKGDEWYSEREGWHRVAMCNVGDLKRTDKPCRRKIVEPATPASCVPDPGEGWRLLNDGETIEAGDEFHSIVGDWCKVDGSVGMTKAKAAERWRSLNDRPFRRRVPAVKSAPVVSVGDRVKVLSGPWAGCTGVVTEVRQWNQNNADVFPKLDNVYIGGQRLTVSTHITDVEPVQPSVIWRELEIGEVIRPVDEICTTHSLKWESAGLSAGSTVGSNMSDCKFYLFRRTARIQSPGWRYLDAGETVKGTDEIWWYGSGMWGHHPVLNGSKVTDAKLFRRKLPVNQGG